MLSVKKQGALCSREELAVPRSTMKTLPRKTRVEYCSRMTNAWRGASGHRDEARGHWTRTVRPTILAALFPSLPSLFTGRGHTRPPPKDKPLAR